MISFEIKYKFSRLENLIAIGCAVVFLLFHVNFVHARPGKHPSNAQYNFQKTQIYDYLNGSNSAAASAANSNSTGMYAGGTSNGNFVIENGNCNATPKKCLQFIN